MKNQLKRMISAYLTRVESTQAAARQPGQEELSLKGSRGSGRLPFAPAKEGTNQGFTLIEMMIVIAIIGLIAGMVGLNVIKKLDESRVSATKIQIKQLGNTLDDFRRICGFYPTTDQGLDALLKAPSGRECKNYPSEGVLSSKKVPLDAWNKEYQYTSDGNKYVLKSFGSDGVEGGDGNNKDISSEDAE
jgi:general secretion pathway protein G